MDDRSATADSDELAEFGYRQELDRTLGNFHTFAAGISYISILTGTFQLFYFGFALGGPAYWWSWPMVFAGQLMVALCFCELAARYPSPARSTTGPSGSARRTSPGSPAG